MSLELYQRGIASYLKGNNKLLQKIISSPQLSLDGKRLLKARHFMRLQDFTTAIELLQRAPCSTGLIYEGDRLFLLGNCYSFKGEWSKALKMNQQGLHQYEKCNYRRGKFLCHYNLSVDCQHLGDVKSESLHLQQAEALADSAEEKALIARAAAFLLAREKKFDKALSLLEDALSVQDLNSIDRVQMQILRVEILTFSGDLESALKLSKSLLNRKSTFERARIVFENHALRFLNHDKSAFTSEKPAVLSASMEYQLKWDLVRALQFGELDRAQDLWAKLAQEVPGHIQDQFLGISRYEAMAVFGRCVMAFRSYVKPRTSGAITAGLENQLLDLLSSAHVPLRKEILIESLWGVNYCSSFDNRFYQLIRRLRKKGFTIYNQHFAYRI